MTRKRSAALLRAAAFMASGKRAAAAGVLMQAAKSAAANSPSGGGKPWPTTVDLLAWWVWWKTWGTTGQLAPPHAIALAIVNFGNENRLEAHRTLWRDCPGFAEAFMNPDSDERFLKKGGG